MKEPHNNLSAMNNHRFQSILHIAVLKHTLAFVILIFLSGCDTASENAYSSNDIALVKTTSPSYTSPAPPIESLIDGLVNRLQANPDDPSSWALLAKSYYFIGETKMAKTAEQEALKRGYRGQIATPSKPVQNETTQQLPANHPPIAHSLSDKASLNALNKYLLEKAP